MMKKTSTLLLLITSCTAYASRIDQHAAYISALQVKTTALETKTNALQNKINTIPQGKQGLQGAQGKQGLQGTQGTQGEKGVKGDVGAVGPSGLRGLPGAYTAGDGIVIEGTVIKANRPTHHIGDLYRGGIVFWLDETGQHGLIASKKDINQNQGVQWHNGESGNKVTNARADGVGAGEGNTHLIIAQQTIDQQSGTFAALISAKYRVQEDGETPCSIPSSLAETCYGGWYLPSAYELALIRANLSQQGISYFAPDYYWSSTECSTTTAWMQNFTTGEQVANDKASTLGQIRAVSRF